MADFCESYARLVSLARSFAELVDRPKQPSPSEFNEILSQFQDLQAAFGQAHRAIGGRITPASLMPLRGEVLSAFDEEEDANTLEA